MLAVQAAEPGPISAVLAATNQALWDLAARRAALPLRRVLNGDAAETVPVYASGLNPTDGVETAARAREAGYRAFKLKIGFGDDIDRRNLHSLRLEMQEDEQLFVDANQRWTLGEAIGQVPMLEEAEVDWLEEPMLAEASASDWRVLRDSTMLALAGGENLRDMDAFRTAFSYLAFVQPDLGKWGGIDGCLAIARAARSSTSAPTARTGCRAGSGSCTPRTCWRRRAGTVCSRWTRTRTRCEAALSSPRPGSSKAACTWSTCPGSASSRPSTTCRSSSPCTSRSLGSSTPARGVARGSGLDTVEIRAFAERRTGHRFHIRGSGFGSMSGDACG